MNPTATNKNTALQDRDISLIRLLAEEFLILSREQIGELFPMGSVARLNYRLKQLRNAGYLSARSLLRVGAANLLGYYLGPQSLGLFDDATERKLVASMRWKAMQLAPSGMPHRMLVDSVHIRFLTAGRDDPAYKLVAWVDQYSPWWGL